MKRFQIMLPEPMMRELQSLSLEKGISTSELIRRGMDTYLESLHKKDFEEFLKINGKGQENEKT